MTATLRDSRTVPSLAELRARKPIEARPINEVVGLCPLTQGERDALVELAEAYLAVRDGANLTGAAFIDAEKRLALAAKGVRP